jgi:hypothetical protein
VSLCLYYVKFNAETFFMSFILSFNSVISNWVTANPSLEKKSSKLIVYSNVLAVKHG